MSGRSEVKWLGAAALVLGATLGAQAEPLNRARIEEITGLKGTWIEAEGVFKVTSPRSDVSVSVDGSPLPPFMGLTSWASFQADQPGKAMVMGDLVLFQDEVNPVLSALLEAGVEVTALHNHFFFDDPKVYFMHIGGVGPTESLAKGVRAALDMVRDVRAKAATPATGSGATPLPGASSITAAPIEEILGVAAQQKDGMLKVVVGRSAKAACGCDVGKEMGVNTWAAFAGSDANALVDGDFAMLATEVQGVLRALRRAGINVVALHHHMTGESPRYLFLHFWGRGRADALARGVRAALDSQR